VPSRPSRQPRSTDIQTEVDCEIFRGSYTVDGGLVKVHLLGAGSKATQAGGLPVEVVAEMLLGELALVAIAQRISRPSESSRD